MTITDLPTHTELAAPRHDLRDPAYQAYSLLRIGFVVAPILFGLDKFLNWLVDWPIYLAPRIDDLVPGNAHQAMLAVGVIEIVAGLVVAIRPRFGGYLVAAWLVGIIINLLVLGDTTTSRCATSACSSVPSPWPGWPPPMTGPGRRSPPPAAERERPGQGVRSAGRCEDGRWCPSSTRPDSGSSRAPSSSSTPTRTSRTAWRRSSASPTSRTGRRAAATTTARPSRSSGRSCSPIPRWSAGTATTRAGAMPLSAAAATSVPRRQARSRSATPSAGRGGGRGWRASSSRRSSRVAAACGVERVVAHTRPDNAASIAVLTGSGFVEVPPDQPDHQRFERRLTAAGTVPSRLTTGPELRAARR